MGYFPNGTAGDMYEHEYCSKCHHEGGRNGLGCAVMLAHIVHNYDECNNPDSILHMLIPRDKDGWNQKCKMFVPKLDKRLEEAAKYIEAMKSK